MFAKLDKYHSNSRVLFFFKNIGLISQRGPIYDHALFLMMIINRLRYCWDRVPEIGPLLRILYGKVESWGFFSNFSTLVSILLFSDRSVHRYVILRRTMCIDVFLGGTRVREIFNINFHVNDDESIDVRTTFSCIIEIPCHHPPPSLPPSIRRV